MNKILALVAIGWLMTLGCAHTIPYGAVAFKVDSNVPDASILIDDVLVGKASDWSKEGKHIRAGFHRIEVRHPGYYSYFTEVELKEGSTVVVKAMLRELIE